MCISNTMVRGILVLLMHKYTHAGYIPLKNNLKGVDTFPYHCLLLEYVTVILKVYKSLDSTEKTIQT